MFVLLFTSDISDSEKLATRGTALHILTCLMYAWV